MRALDDFKKNRRLSLALIAVPAQFLIAGSGLAQSGWPNKPVRIVVPFAPGGTTGSWFGLLAPAGTPQDIVNRIQQEVAKSLNTPAIKEKLLAQGAIPSGNTPSEFTKLIDAEHKKWAKVVKDSGAKVD